MNSYSCACTPEYIGRTCSQSYCTVNNPCRNGATCHGAGRCLCPSGFVGADCSIDQCDVLECQNGGSCVNGSCVCPAGVIGANCDIIQCTLMICMVRVVNSVVSLFFICQTHFNHLLCTVIHLINYYLSLSTSSILIPSSTCIAHSGDFRLLLIPASCYRTC